MRMHPFLTNFVALSIFGLVACATSDVRHTSSNQSAFVTPPTPAPNGASLSPPASTEATPANAVAKTRVDACSLLTTDEIKSVQGESLKESKASSGAENGLSISQCFFNLSTFSNSINLAVTQKGDGPGARDPKDFWRASFNREREREKERESERRTSSKERREEEEAARPETIKGLGDQAFWSGNRVGGTLYVLKGNTFIRVSVGGKGSQQSKINKSKALARLALKRL